MSESMHENAYEDNQMLQVLTLQIKCAEEKEESLLQIFNSGKARLIEAKNDVLTASSRLVNQCTAVVQPQNRFYFSSGRGLVTHEARQVSEKEKDIQQLRDTLSTLNNSKEEMTREINIRKQAVQSSEDSSLHQYEEKCDCLRSREESLKEECRQLRKELAQRRQKQWYAKVLSDTPIAHKRQPILPRNSQVPANTSKNTPGDNSDYFKNANSPMKTRCGKRASTCNISHEKTANKSTRNVTRQENYSKPKMVGGPDQKQTKISQYMFPKPRTTQTGGKFNFKPTSMSLNTKATSREFISASDLTRPASPHKENIEQMDYDYNINENCDDTASLLDLSAVIEEPLSQENRMRPAIGANRFSTSCHESPLAEKSMEFVEARKEANNRHFMFLTNF